MYPLYYPPFSLPTPLLLSPLSSTIFYPRFTFPSFLPNHLLLSIYTLFFLLFIDPFYPFSSHPAFYPFYFSPSFLPTTLLSTYFFFSLYFFLLPLLFTNLSSPPPFQPPSFPCFLITSLLFFLSLFPCFTPTSYFLLLPIHSSSFPDISPPFFFICFLLTNHLFLFFFLSPPFLIESFTLFCFSWCEQNRAKTTLYLIINFYTSWASRVV